MNTFDYIVIGLCLFLLINEASRYGAFILILGKFFYFSLIINIDSGWYYTASAMLNITMGHYLYCRYKLASLCAYATVFVNVIGFWLWVNYYPPGLYDVMFAVLMIIQLFFISSKALTYVRTRNNIKHPMAFFVSFDSCWSHVTMYKIQKNKEQACEKK
jgi:hypothetical protein